MSEGLGHQFREDVLRAYGRRWRETWERTGDAVQADYAAKETMRAMVEIAWERQVGRPVYRHEDDPSGW